MHESPISFYVLGAQKCATTWLYQSLRAQAGVHVSRHKQEDLYVGGTEYARLGWAGFLETMGTWPAGAGVGDVSVNYLYDPRSASALYEVSPQARLIILLRNPVDRFTSAFHWNYRKNQLQGTLAEAAKCVLDHRCEPGDLYHELFARGLYGEQLERYLACFPADQFFIVNQEAELKQNPEEVYRRIVGLLGVEAGDLPEAVHTRPKQASGHRWLMQLERMQPHSRYVAESVNRLHQWLRRRGADEAEALDPVLRERLAERYQDDHQKLLGLLEGIPSTQVSPLESFRSWLTRP